MAADHSKWLYQLTSAEIEDLEHAARHYLGLSRDIGEISSIDFPLGYFSAHLHRLKKKLLDGVGVEVIVVPGAIGNAQLLASGQLPSVEQFIMTRVYPVIISLPEDFPDELRKVGLAASVTIHTEGAGVVGIVAVVLQWVGTSMDAIL